MKPSKSLKLVLKIVISAAALYYVITSIDLIEIWGMIISANPIFLIVGLLFYTASQVAASFRLKKLFEFVPIPVSTFVNIKLYWLGLFYNLFLPGGVGGDGYKIWFIRKWYKTEIKRVFGAIISDRISGLTVIVVMLFLIVPFLDYALPFKRWVWIAIPFVAMAYFLFLHLFNRSLRPAFFPVLLYALVVQGLQMICAYFILLSIGAPLDGYVLAYLFLFFVSAIAGSLPITLGGIGAREFVFMWGAQYLGIDVSSAIALSLLFYASSALTALPGVMFTIKPSAMLNHDVESPD
ncbi:lysylphosphatidylglycerol synthase transmembrane domain-containing protein [Alkalitalea saponilacus]|uniref:Lysylphosphatidylglycerol synthase TM region n=1 Tax=Alkalitalea saponilacus TaxID=889453 RepID=A0A1T5A5K2_9BACT|nr:lysylphosphatidylglycerol synthase transmembrane domain-containing protein [Alkalitalea saponilacus]ASB48851.1 lysylphosphatidylglycerol synthetase [Alkalitalea saponilacus]SKB29923.1 hypothetical protein SAMN03080601_00087 [Alkalitalea saponilacus]